MLQAVVRCHVDARKQTWVLWKRSQGSELNHFSPPHPILLSTQTAFLVSMHKTWGSCMLLREKFTRWTTSLAFCQFLVLDNLVLGFGPQVLFFFFFFCRKHISRRLWIVSNSFLEEIQLVDARGHYCTIKHMPVSGNNSLFQDNDGVLFWHHLWREWALKKNYSLRGKVSSF